jgi:hypothetical protein
MTQPFEGHESSTKVLLLVCKQTGDTVKLREPPKAFTTKLASKDVSGRANSPGYSQNVKDVTMGDLQPSPKGSSTTYGCSSTTRRQWVWHKDHA